MHWFSLAADLLTMVVVALTVEFVLLGWARNEETLAYILRQRGDEELAEPLEAKARRLRRLAWPLRLFVRP